MDKSLCGCFDTVYKDMYNGVEQREPQTDNNGQMMYSHCEVFCLIHLLGAGLAQTS